MAYEKNSWENGDVITANKLNHMEDGIADSGSGDSSLELHAIRGGSLPAYSGEEIQAIMEALPDKVVIITDLTDDPGYPNFTKAIYRLTQVMETPEHVPVYCVYSYENIQFGDGVQILYFTIYCDTEPGIVDGIEIKTSIGSSVTTTEYAYNSSTGNWEYDAN